MRRTLHTVEDVSRMIADGETLLLAGDEALLAALPRGNWIGGTIPYFMSGESGGAEDHHHIFVTRFPAEAAVHDLRLYDEETLADFADAGADNGFSIVLLPAFSKVHTLYAQNISHWNNAFARPVAGWVAGVALDAIGRVSPKVFDGRTGIGSDAHAAILHVALPESHYADIDIVNLFEQGDGEPIAFPDAGFSARDVLIGGERQNLAAYIAEQGIDPRLPLVADYSGAMINVSLEKTDAETGDVHFYAPVFPGIAYRFARPVGEYTEEFLQRMSALESEPAFSCNCILNYLYAGLEGKRTSHLVGPITFGEIAYVLLNQTLVYLTICQRD